MDDPNDPDQDPEIHTPRPTSPMIKLCRSLEQKRKQQLRTPINESPSSSSSPENECPESTTTSSHTTITRHPEPEEVVSSQTNKDHHHHRVRHVRIQVNGQWGYYSGPKIIIEREQ